MDEPSLRQLIDQVKRGRVSRRVFVQTMAALGIGAPLAAQMLASAGVAAAQPREPYLVPTRRGGGGDLRILMWDAPTMLHPHFGRGLRDMTASRLFYEPLAAPAPDGTFVPVLAEEHPERRKNGGLAKDGQWVIWRLKKNVVWHDGVPFTADDVIFNWTFAIDPANVTSTRGAFEEVARIDKLDSHTVKVVYKKPQPFWGAVFTGGGLLPRHIFEPLKGAGSRDAIGMVKPVGTGPYKLVEFKPGDWIRAEINPTYHVPNRPYFDRLDIKCGGDSPSAVRAVMQTGEYDFAYYVLMEEDVLRRLEQGGTKGRILTIPSQRRELHPVQPERPVDRGGRRAIEPAVHASLPVRPRGADRARASSSTGRRSRSTWSAAPVRSRPTSSMRPTDSARRTPRGSSTSTRPTRSSTRRDGRAGRTASAPRTASASRCSIQAAANATVQKVQMVVKQAAARAGIEIEVKAVQAERLLLVGREQPRHQCPLPRRSADLHDLHRPRSPGVHGPVRVLGAARRGRTSGRAGTSPAGGTRSSTGSGARPTSRWTRSSAPRSSSA